MNPAKDDFMLAHIHQARRAGIPKEEVRLMLLENVRGMARRWRWAPDRQTAVEARYIRYLSHVYGEE